MFIIDGELAFIVVQCLFRPLEGGEHIVLICIDELVRRQHVVVLIGYSHGVFREFTRQIALLVERIFHLSQIFHLLVLETIRHIAFEEPVGVEIGCRLRRSSQTHTVNVVAGNNRIDRTDVHLARMVLGTRFHKVFNQCFQAEENVLESLDIGQLGNESAHVAFGFGQFLGTIAVPEVIVTHHGVHVLDFLPLLLEYTFLSFQETVIGITGDTTHHEASAEEVQLAKHVVRHLHPFARGEGTKLLLNGHGFYKVHIRLLGQVQYALLQTIGGVRQNIERTRETEVLRIVGHKAELETLVLFHVSGIHDIIAVEADTVVRNRTIERILQQTDTVLVHIHILENILQYRSEHVTRIEKLVHPRRVDTFDDMLLALRILAVDNLRQCLVHRKREDVLVNLRTIFHLLTEERILLKEFGFAKRVGRNVIQSQRQLLIYIIIIVVLLLEVVQFLTGHHFFHQFHGRVVLA